MVYSVFYYATEAITRAFIGLFLKIAERMRRRRMVEERRRERPPAPAWGFFGTTNPYGVKEYVWIGRATELEVSIPALIRLPIKAHELEKPPTRLYFTFAEAASKDWFKEIEKLAEQVEKARGGKGVS